jgi:N6-adenosine-specific RNA methylase IME4
MCPRGQHSVKPSRIRNEIVKLMGDLPRIELFARPPKDRLFEDESYKGWDLWGDEV